jgi:hypothetical protein
VITLVNFAAVVLILLLLIPAAARLTRLVSRDDITSLLRVWVYSKFGETSLPARLVQCHWCVGVWVSLILSGPTWVAIAHLTEWPPLIMLWMWMLSVPAVAYEASRKIDREGM